VAHINAFFAEILVHTKGRWARTPFRLARWQLDEIIAPLFGTVTYSAEAQRYVRRYRIAWLEMARKQGKSEMLAGIGLYLLAGDDEQGAEIYGCACDRDQARKVYDVAKRMVQLSPELSGRLRPYEQPKRIVDDKTASYYEIVSSDAAGNLGHNPHGILFDEVISQKDSSLWTAMRTAMGAREQPLMVAATTAGDDPQSFAKDMHDEMVRIADDPQRARHIFVFIRNTPADADPWDETNWAYANPALGDFLSLDALREEAVEARNDPLKENSFRQFRLNQWVSQASRWMPMHLWDDCVGDLWLKPDWGLAQLAGRPAYGGFDLAAKFDLTSWCLLVPDSEDPNECGMDLLWRFWLPAEAVPKLDQLSGGKFSHWAKAGWIAVTDGAVIDYDKVIADVAADAGHFAIGGIDCDEWSMWPVINRIADTCGLDIDSGEVTAYRNTYDRMSPGMADLMGLVKTGRIRQHANPVARFCFDSCEVRAAPYDPNLVRPVKPERGRDRTRIDGVVAAAMAVNCWTAKVNVEPYRSAYEDSHLMVV
jgi:phage terminase large subunit-like protein